MIRDTSLYCLVFLQRFPPNLHEYIVDYATTSALVPAPSV